MERVYTTVCIQVYSSGMDDEDQLSRASEVFKEAERKESGLYAWQRVEKASRGELDWTTLQEVCERLRRYAYDMEPDPEVRMWIDELVDHHWELMFYLTTLYVTDPT